jgi:nucleolin
LIQLSSDVESDGSDRSDSEVGSEDDSEDSDASEEIVAEIKQNKRKAEEETASTFKKAKTVSADVGKNGESKNLFVGNLSFGIDEDGLHSEFKEFGEVTGCRVVYDRDSGRSKG